MTDAEVRELMKRYDRLRHAFCASHSKSTRKRIESVTGVTEDEAKGIVTLAQEHLRLKAAVLLIHGEPVHGQAFLAVCKAKEIIDQVARELHD